MIPLSLLTSKSSLSLSLDGDCNNAFIPQPTMASSSPVLPSTPGGTSRRSMSGIRPIRPLVETESTVLQHHAESECKPFFVDLSSLPKSQLDHLKEVGLIAAGIDGETNAGNDDDGGLRQQETEQTPSSLPEIQVLRSKHMSYVEQVWKRPLKAPFVSLDSSRPWMLYWCLHAYDLLQHQQQEEEDDDDDDQVQQDEQQQHTNKVVDGGKNTEAAAAAAAAAAPTPSEKEAPLQLQLQITNTEGNNMVETLRDCFQSYYYGTIRSPPPESSTTSSSRERSGDGGGDGGGANQSSLYYETHPMDGCGGDGDGENEEDDEKEERRPGSSPRPHSYYCGGFGGGPGQMAHAATTYAAVLVLCILATDHDNTGEHEDGSEEAAKSTAASTATTTHYSVRAMELLESVRIPLYRWIVSLQEPSTAGPHAGGFRMHHDGEVDVRATYCVMTVAALLGFIPSSSLSSSSTPPTTSAAMDQSVTINRQSAIDYVVRCQTYEGGLGGEPWTEAHGGYTFCGVAALQLLGYFHRDATTDSSSSSLSSQRLDIQSLIGWLSRRQQSFEGGFSGRSNKLVDGCYSFWQGGAIAITSAAVAQISDGDTTPNDPWLDSYRQQGSERGMKDSLDVPFPLLFDVAMLERYILLCAQEVEGGLRDKPSKPRDFYHSCYNLSGLSVAQKCSYHITDKGYGDPKQTSLATTHPVYNIRIERVDVMLKKTWC